MKMYVNEEMESAFTAALRQLALSKMCSDT